MVEPRVLEEQVGGREWGEVDEVFGAQQVSQMYWQVAAWGFADVEIWKKRECQIPAVREIYLWLHP